MSYSAKYTVFAPIVRSEFPKHGVFNQGVMCMSLSSDFLTWKLSGMASPDNESLDCSIGNSVKDTSNMVCVFI